MAGGSLLALLDDIATVLDDIALMTKVAAKKTAGVLGDDLALNAEQVAGVRAERELPVVWAVTKGSLVNKCILVPVALVVSAFAPWAIIPALMLGGAFLCYEGCEKIWHSLTHPNGEVDTHAAELSEALQHADVDLRVVEKEKIKGAIRTDFILSGEIIVITLGTVAEMDLLGQSVVLSLIALVMTIGVYGLVAGIVKLDDGGLYLTRLQGSSGWRKFQRHVGRAILTAAPWLMKSLSVIGTLAMFLVGGGILVHGLIFLHHWQQIVEASLPGILGVLGGGLFNIVVGLVAGTLLIGAMSLGQRLWLRSRAQ